jgi:hypothetical protein
MRPLEAQAIRFAHAVVGSLVWGGDMKGIKKRERGRAQALGSRLSFEKCNNQPKDSVGRGEGV